MEFSALGLADPILRAVREAGYTTCTPIQSKAIAPVLEGRDLIGLAQTGTGKTAAFALPILHRLSVQPGHPGIRCLVLAPTRELASQVHDSFKTYGRHVRLFSTVIFGGVGQGAQVAALRRGLDILVACPGRLLDLIGQGFVNLNAVEVLILDEADRMLDMGFMPDIRRIIQRLPPKRQNLLFSATMPGEIRSLSREILRDPVEVSVAPVSAAADTVDQHVYLVPQPQKQALLHHILHEDAAMERVIVFTRTKHGADRVVKHLDRAGIGSAAIHGNKSQNARVRALEGFRSGQLRVLVASDIAARGLDIDGITHVVNFDLPDEPETYVHRIGRTGRAGASGIALSFVGGEDRDQLNQIERIIRKRVPVRTLPTFAQLPPPPPGQHHGHTDGHDHPGRRSHGQSHGNRFRAHRRR